MIKKIFNERLNWMIERVIEDEVLSLEPVIAGGCALSIFKSVELHKKDSDWKAFRNRMIRKSSWKGSIPPYNDVDIWFLKAEESVESLRYKFKNKFSDRSNSNLSYTPSVLKKETKWGRTYSISNKTYQFINTSHDSVKDLLDTFDLVNSKYAWHKGYFYFCEDAERSFENGHLSFYNKSVKDDSPLYEKVFHCLRYFKYSIRYGIDFDKEVANFVYNVYLEIQNSIIEGNLKEKLKCGKKVAVTAGDVGYFSFTNSNVEMISDMRKSFCQFCIMETFKPEWLLYLIPSSNLIPEIKNLIESNFDKEYLVKNMYPASSIDGIPF
tara:strand:- start:6775 stop:7746 length:972 start_codon:yes stop_codon:yes gene_type:complete